MRQFVVMVMLAIFFFSCSNNHSVASLTKEDSLEIYKALAGIKNTSLLAMGANNDTVPGKKDLYSFKSNFNIPAAVIPFSDAKTLHKAYLNNPIPGLVNSNGALIRGFKIGNSDFQRVTGVQGYGARIYLGYDQTNSQYRLMLVAMNASRTNVTAAIIDDFFPCPDHCPTDDTEGSPAELRSRFENDLNYVRTIGNEVEYMDFGGTLKRIQYQ